MDKNIIGKMLYINGVPCGVCEDWQIDYCLSEVFFIFEFSDMKDVDYGKTLAIGDIMLTAGEINSFGNSEKKCYVGVSIYDFLNSALYDFQQLADVIEG